MLKVDALRHQLEDADVGDVDASLELEMTQLWAAAPDEAQPAVRQPRAPVQTDLRSSAGQHN